MFIFQENHYKSPTQSKEDNDKINHNSDDQLVSLPQFFRQCSNFNNPLLIQPHAPIINQP